MNGNAPSHEQVNDLVLLDVSKDAREAARDRADARLVEELNEGSRLKRGLKAIWKGGVAKEYYRHKYIQQAHQEITASQDVLLHEDQNEHVRRQAMLLTIERFQNEYDESIHTGRESKEIS